MCYPHLSLSPSLSLSLSPWSESLSSVCGQNNVLFDVDRGEEEWVEGNT